jgi:hypothetical protein
MHDLDHIYLDSAKNTGKRPKLCLLGWELDEDGIATMSVATLLAIEDDGTCKAPNRLVYSLNVGTTIDTRESNNTHTR